MYYIIFLIGIFFSLLQDKKKVLFIIYTLILLLLAYFRYGVGPDYFAYEYLFYRLNESPLKEVLYGLDQQEPLFRLLGSIMKFSGFSYQSYLIFIATINLVFIYKICKKYSVNPTLSLFLYFCFYYFVWTYSGLRQGMTMAIGAYYLLECINQRKHLKFFMIVIILSFIHTSSLILIPLYVISKMNFSKKQLIYLSFLSILVAVLPIGTLISYLNNAPFIGRILPYTDIGYSINNIFDFQSIGRIVFLIIAFFYYDVFSKQSELNKKMINMYVISLMIYFLFKFSELTAARLSIYGKFLDVIILTNIYYFYKDKVNKAIYIGGLIILSTMYMFKELHSLKERTGLESNYALIVPYTNIFNKDKYHFQNRYEIYIKKGEY
ncbi:EpsG family protein [Heyndrickxia oleronia]|uniref:EpsG family protein n=1 Tax=Heyndrickxia oleronia TaxID=38875 RepID=UPI001AE07298|nr:EpsG family protein [Heyndrickxia oleronia]MEC1374186.1 EpsG family protein [Heyndrickxia oleronia]QQZ07209.1 EpsG family protein [Heyndrickxia oleronia]